MANLDPMELWNIIILTRSLTYILYFNSGIQLLLNVLCLFIN
jgi:hypothetical protein